MKPVRRSLFVYLLDIFGICIFHNELGGVNCPGYAFTFFERNISVIVGVSVNSGRTYSFMRVPPTLPSSLLILYFLGIKMNSSTVKFPF